MKNFEYSHHVKVYTFITIHENILKMRCLEQFYQNFHIQNDISQGANESALRVRARRSSTSCHNAHAPTFCVRQME